MNILTGIVVAIILVGALYFDIRRNKREDLGLDDD